MTQPMIWDAHFRVCSLILDSELEASSKSLLPPPGAPFLNSIHGETPREETTALCFIPPRVPLVKYSACSPDIHTRLEPAEVEGTAIRSIDNWWVQ